MFGEIENVRMHRKPGYCMTFVLFKNALDAASALSNRFQRVNGKVLRVLPADSWHQPTVTSDTNDSTENNDEKNAAGATRNDQNSNDISGTTISDLNDDCLMEVFNRLSIKSLCNVAEVSKRFKQNAETVFSLEYKCFDPIKLYSLNDGHFEVTLNEFRNVLKNFGSLINELTVSKMTFKSSQNNRILDLILKYCKGTLKTLELDGFTIKGIMVQKLTPVVESLEKLILNGCDVDDSIGNLLKHCGGLKKLKICDQQYGFQDCRFLEQEYPNLQSFTLKSVGLIRQSNLNVFVTKNPNIQKIKIKNCDGVKDKIFGLIADKLNNLEKLSINLTDYDSLFTNNLDPIKKMKNLKKLELKCGRHSISTVIGELESKDILTQLVLTKVTVDDELIDSICAMPNLTILKLTDVHGFDKSHLRKIAKNKCDLSELHLADCEGVSKDGIIELVKNSNELQDLSIHKVDITVDETFYTNLLQTVRARLDKTKLMVFCDFTTIPLSMIEKNRNVLDIMDIGLDCDSSEDFDDTFSDDTDSVYDYDSDIGYNGYFHMLQQLGFGFDAGFNPYDSDDSDVDCFLF